MVISPKLFSTNKFHKTTFQINVRPLKNIKPFFFIDFVNLKFYMAHPVYLQNFKTFDAILFFFNSQKSPTSNSWPRPFWFFVGEIETLTQLTSNTSISFTSAQQRLAQSREMRKISGLILCGVRDSQGLAPYCCLFSLILRYFLEFLLIWNLSNRCKAL